MDASKEKLKALWRRDVKRRLIAAGLESAAALARAGFMPAARGRGAIFTLHHVRPLQAGPFQPNGHLEITPDFLDAALKRLLAEGYEFVSLAEVPERLASGSRRPFAAFTLDDGYRNNAEHALPVFERHKAPCTIFVAQGFAERTHSLWWETVAALLAQQYEIQFDFGNGPEHLDLGSEARKLDIFERFCSFVTQREERDAIRRIDQLARRHGIEPLEITARLTMDRDELQQLARHPIVALGAHTVSHAALARRPAAEAKDEMRRSADWLEELTGSRPAAIAYPYGDRTAASQREFDLARDMGFAVGVTTRPGTLAGASGACTTGLPRISLNGYYQQARYVSALASGIPFVAMR